MLITAELDALQRQGVVLMALAEVDLPQVRQQNAYRDLSPQTMKQLLPLIDWV